MGVIYPWGAASRALCLLKELTPLTGVQGSSLLLSLMVSLGRKKCV